MKKTHENIKLEHKFRDLGQVERVVSESGAILDSDIFILIDEAEAGDYKVMEELWILFTYGSKKVKPNLKLAERYWLAIRDYNMFYGSTFVAQSKADYAFMHSEFSQDKDEVVRLVVDAIQYMVNQVEPGNWDSPRLFKLHKIIDSTPISIN